MLTCHVHFSACSFRIVQNKLLVPCCCQRQIDSFFSKECKGVSYLLFDGRYGATTDNSRDDILDLEATDRISYLMLSDARVLLFADSDSNPVLCSNPSR